MARCFREIQGFDRPDAVLAGVYLAFNQQNDEHMRDIVTSATECLEATLTVTTMTDNSGGDATIRLYAPIEAWNARTLTWNTKPQVLQN